jgi:hypothetical protein
MHGQHLLVAPAMPPIGLQATTAAPTAAAAKAGRQAGRQAGEGTVSAAAAQISWCCSTTSICPWHQPASQVAALHMAVNRQRHCCEPRLRGRTLLR